MSQINALMGTEVWVIESDKFIINQLTQFFTSTLINQEIFPVVEEFMLKIKNSQTQTPQLILLSSKVESHSGYFILQELRKIFPHIPVLILGNEPTGGEISLMQEDCFCDFLLKPLNQKFLLAKILALIHPKPTYDLKLNPGLHILFQLFKKRSFEDADAFVENELVFRESHCDLLYLKSLLLIEKEKHSEAKQVLIQNIGFNSNHIPSLQLLGEIEYKLNNFKNSITLLEKANLQGPMNTSRLEILFHIYLGNGQFQSADRCAERLLSLERKNTKYQFLRAEVLAFQNKLTEVRNFSNQYHDLDHMSSQLNMRAVLFTKENMMIQALRGYDLAESLIYNKKKKYVIHYNKSITYFLLKDKEKAILELNSVRLNAPEDFRELPLFERAMHANDLEKCKELLIPHLPEKVAKRASTTDDDDSFPSMI